MTATDYCAECNQMATSHIEVRTEQHFWQGTTYTLDDVQVRVCDSCGQDRVDPELDDASLMRLYEMQGRTSRP